MACVPNAVNQPWIKTSTWYVSHVIKHGTQLLIGLIIFLTRKKRDTRHLIGLHRFANEYLLCGFSVSKGRDTLGDKSLRHVALWDIVQSWDNRCNVSSATCRTNSNQFEFVQHVATTKWAIAALLRQIVATKYKLTNESASCIFALLNWKTSSHSAFSKFAACAPNKRLVAATCFEAIRKERLVA